MRSKIFKFSKILILILISIILTKYVKNRELNYFKDSNTTKILSSSNLSRKPPDVCKKINLKFKKKKDIKYQYYYSRISGKLLKMNWVDIVKELDETKFYYYLEFDKLHYLSFKRKELIYLYDVKRSKITNPYINYMPDKVIFKIPSQKVILKTKAKIENIKICQLKKD